MPSMETPIGLSALDHAPWSAMQEALRQALQARQLDHLTAPTTLVLHDLLDGSLRAMHRQVFHRIVEADFGLAPDADDEHFEMLFRTELAEHGSQNVARACEAGGWNVFVRFPGQIAGAPDVLVQIDVPVALDDRICHTEKLIEALGYDFSIDRDGPGSRIRLLKQAGRAATLAAPDLLDGAASRASVGDIFEELDYGLIHFSAVGEIIAVSPSMLSRLRLENGEGAIRALADAIPLSFHNDIVWGLALAEGNGAFENYRIRVRLPGTEQVSILFNVSGFRRQDGSIRSLWQAVSRDQGTASLSEGSILSEVRIHNITRNYVPQLVEQKARDAVRLGKTALTNEQRKVAVLFCDVVGFTSYVERNEGNESIIDTLNSILRRISSSVKSNHGSIDKFMGDCIMALFDNPADAVLAAIDMQSHSDDINSLRFRAGQQTLQLRIGVHWGEVIIGNVGTAERLDWTAIGDVVNTASRIEKACQPGSTLISVDVREAIEPGNPGRFGFGEVFGIQVKGKQHALAVCHVTLATP